MQWTEHFCDLALQIFHDAIDHYHIKRDVESSPDNPYTFKTIEYMLYQKCWIDTIQWHMEDNMRDPQIDPEEALAVRRHIDRCNQDRTDMVELIDGYFEQKFENVVLLPDARINTESPAWALDRLSILQLKIYHMRVESQRSDTSDAQRETVKTKLKVLEEQNRDLTKAITELLRDIAAGKVVMKVYKQMKMYNDPNLNPVLYSKKD
ncbi:MAG: DUF4254 domain-containing protein [Porphyromonas sp.]|nr:DUF4254 domain-containing protein [Porphyromonas sp.]